MEEDWLLSLKEGDHVCYHSQYHGYVVLTILKITPTGQIKTTNGYTFKNGTCKLDSWTYYNLEPITDKVLQALERVELFRKINQVDFKKLSSEKMKAILEIVEE